MAIVARLLQSRAAGKSKHVATRKRRAGEADGDDAVGDGADADVETEGEPSLAVLLLLAQVLLLVRGQVVQAGVRQRLVVPVPVHRMVAKVTGPASALELIAQSRH